MSDRYIEFELPQLATELPRRNPGVDHYSGQWVCGAERRHGKGQCRRRGGFCAEAQCPGDARLDGCRLGLEGLLFGQNPLGPHHKPFALGRQTLILVPTIDQSDVELPLKLGDRRRECRLRDVAGLGGPREVLLARNSHEVFQLTKQHQPELPGSAYNAGRLTTIASCVLRAITITAGLLGSGFSSRCGTYGGTKT